MQPLHHMQKNSDDIVGKKYENIKPLGIFCRPKYLQHRVNPFLPETHL